MPATATPSSSHDHLTLCEALDRVLNKGVVVHGEVVITVADVDLVYLGFNAVLSSVETAERTMVGRMLTDRRERRGQPS